MSDAMADERLRELLSYDPRTLRVFLNRLEAARAASMAREIKPNSAAPAHSGIRGSPA